MSDKTPRTKERERLPCSKCGVAFGHACFEPDCPNAPSPAGPDALAEWLHKNAPDCGDNSCLFGGRGKGGMRTNGGCRCFKDLPTMKRIYVERLQTALRSHQAPSRDAGEGMVMPKKLTTRMAMVLEGLWYGGPKDDETYVHLIDKWSPEWEELKAAAPGAGKGDWEGRWRVWFHHGGEGAHWGHTEGTWAEHCDELLKKFPGASLDAAMSQQEGKDG